MGVTNHLQSGMILHHHTKVCQRPRSTEKSHQSVRWSPLATWSGRFYDRGSFAVDWKKIGSNMFQHICLFCVLPFSGWKDFSVWGILISCLHMISFCWDVKETAKQRTWPIRWSKGGHFPKHWKQDFVFNRPGKDMLLSCGCWMTISQAARLYQVSFVTP